MPTNFLDPGMPVPLEILQILGSSTDMASACDKCFNTVGVWCRILSQRRLLHRIASFNRDSDSSVALLLMVMKPVSEVPPQSEDPRTESHWIAKQFLALVESAPLLSIHLLQAHTLMAIYEIGHAIYPAGYLSVGHAVRLGHSMRLHDRKSPARTLRPPTTWTASEEESRVWWCTVILDPVCCPTSKLCSISTGSAAMSPLEPTVVL
jgi:hypothetical protein